MAWQISGDTDGADTFSLQWSTADQFPGALLKSETPADMGTSGQIAVTPSDLLSWQSGETYYLQLCRQRQFSGRSATGGLSKTMESCSARRPVLLVE